MPKLTPFAVLRSPTLVRNGLAGASARPSVKSTRALCVEQLEQRILLAAEVMAATIHSHWERSDIEHAHAEVATHDSVGVSEVQQADHAATGHTATVMASMLSPPTVSITANLDATSTTISIQLTHFDLSEAAVDGAHVDGQGHLHLYVDGEKISRVFSDTYQIDGLSPGTHIISVDLNSNDHRAYVIDGTKIEASVHLSVPASASESPDESLTIASSPAFATSINSGTISIPGVNAGEESGASVYSAGDFNKDGIDDLVIGAPTSAGGEVYVVFGSDFTLSSSLDLSTLNGTNGFKLIGVTSGDLAGTSVGGGSDINADGFDDIVIGAPGADPYSRANAGSTYVVFGSASFGATFNLSLLNGTNGFRIDGASAGDNSGQSVAIAGDVNQDNFPDVIIGAPMNDDGGTNAGAAYVLFGKSTGFGATTDLASLSPTSGFRIHGTSTNQNLGFSVQTAGDMNNDSVDDVIIGAPTGITGTAANGSAYVVFGNASGLSDISVGSLIGTNGFQLQGVNTGDQAGYAVSTAGDVNDDGISDVIIGSPRAKVDGVSVGAAYVIFGQSANFPGIIDLGSLDGTNGFRVGGDYQSDPLLRSFIVNETRRDRLWRGRREFRLGDPR